MCARDRQHPEYGGRTGVGFGDSLELKAKEWRVSTHATGIARQLTSRRARALALVSVAVLAAGCSTSQNLNPSPPVSTASTSATDSASPSASDTLGSAPLGATAAGQSLTTTLTSDPKASPAPGSVGAVPHMDMTIAAGTGLDLKLASQTTTQASTNCGGGSTTPPTTVAAGESANFCFQSGSVFHPDAETTFTYAIADSTDVLWAHSNVPLAGSNVVECQVRKNGTDKLDTRSLYACSVAWTADGGHGNNPKPKVSVFAKPTAEVTDINQARKILIDNCAAGQPECTYKSAKQQIVAAPQSQWRLYGSPQTNCNSKEPDKHIVADGQTISWKDTFGIKATAKFDLKVVKAEVEGEYAHEIEEAHEFSEHHEQSVEYGTTAAFFIQPGVLDIVGDFLISTPDKVYSIKNFAFDIPISSQYNPPGGGTPIPQQRVISMSWPTDCSKPDAGPKVKQGDPPPLGAVKISST